MLSCPLEQSVAHRIMCTAAKLERFVNRFHFESMDLTFSSAMILFIVKMGETTPAGIREFLGVTKSNVTQRLNALEEKGLVERRRDMESDRRTQTLRLTSEGEVKYTEINRILSSRALELEQTIGKTDAADLRRILSKIDALVEDQNTSHGCAGIHA
jgi:DNA-binding MarR family transcriptional regulator